MIFGLLISPTSKIIIAIGIIIILAAAIILGAFAFAAAICKIAFGSRGDKNPLLKYFTAEDFSLTAKAVETRGRRGFLYTDEKAEKNGKLIIFCHGMGAGQVMYTTEIAYFCKKGFTVLALDYRGCNFSEGKNIRGMYEGVESVIAAIDYAASDENLKGMPVYLVGHSWGGYSALCAQSKRKVAGTVAMSSPKSPVKTIGNSVASQVSPFLAAFISPALAVIDFFKFGKNSNMNAAKCAEKSKLPVMLIHGDEDTVVPMKKSAYFKANGKNIEKYLAANKSHNPYNTPEAQRLVAELSQKLSKAGEMTKEELEYFEKFDYTASTEEDEEVMRAICDFIDRH